jgi:hypothetical protein
VCFQIIIIDSNPDRSSDDLIVDSLICRDTNTIPIKHIHLTNEQMEEYPSIEDANTIDALSTLSKKEESIKFL